MMRPVLAIVAALVLHQEPVHRTPAIYRCPAPEAEAEAKLFLEKLMEDDGFDTLCIDPKPGPLARAAAKGKMKFIAAALVDTKANLQWRNATIAFAEGKISPRKWLARTKNLHETVHFLSSPSTPTLRNELFQLAGNTYSARSVFAEMFLLCLPGKPCLTSGDIWRTKELPPAGRLQSWILAMNDFLGPMLAYRYDSPNMVSDPIEVLRADPKPGLLVFRQKRKGKTLTFFFNNGPEPVELPPLQMDQVTINRGLDVDSPKPRLSECGNLIEELDNK